MCQINKKNDSLKNDHICNFLSVIFYLSLKRIEFCFFFLFCFLHWIRPGFMLLLCVRNACENMHACTLNMHTIYTMQLYNKHSLSTYILFIHPFLFLSRSLVLSFVQLKKSGNSVPKSITIPKKNARAFQRFMFCMFFVVSCKFWYWNNTHAIFVHTYVVNECI